MLQKINQLTRKGKNTSIVSIKYKISKSLIARVCLNFQKFLNKYTTYTAGNIVIPSLEMHEKYHKAKYQREPMCSKSIC